MNSIRKQSEITVWICFAYKEIGAFDLFVNKHAKLFQVEHKGTTLSELELI